MDRKPYALWIELFRGLGGLFLIILTGDWFGIDDYLPFMSVFIALYFLITIFGGIYFTHLEKGPDTLKTAI